MRLNSKFQINSPYHKEKQSVKQSWDRMSDKQKTKKQKTKTRKTTVKTNVLKCSYIKYFINLGPANAIEGATS